VIQVPHLVGLLVYLFASWFLLVGLLRLVTHRKYYFHLVPFVVAYAVLAAFLLGYFGFRDFFWWYLMLSSIFFFVNLRKCFKSHVDTNFNIRRILAM